MVETKKSIFRIEKTPKAVTEFVEAAKAMMPNSIILVDDMMDQIKSQEIQIMTGAGATPSLARNLSLQHKALVLMHNPTVNMFKAVTAYDNERVKNMIVVAVGSNPECVTKTELWMSRYSARQFFSREFVVNDAGVGPVPECWLYWLAKSVDDPTQLVTTKDKNELRSALFSLVEQGYRFDADTLCLHASRVGFGYKAVEKIRGYANSVLDGAHVNGVTLIDVAHWERSANAEM